MLEERDFLAAVRSGDADTVHEYLRHSDANIESRGEYGETALMLAAQKGHGEIVALLIENGADVDAVQYVQEGFGTALDKAVEMGEASVVKLLLSAGANVNSPGSGRSDALLAAARNGRLSIVQELLDAGADCHSSNADSTNVLMLLSSFGPQHVVNPEPELHKPLLQRVLDAGVNVDAIGRLNRSALSCAYTAGNEAIVSFLLKAGADPNLAASMIPDSEIVRHPGCLELLIEGGLDRSCFTKMVSHALLAGNLRSAETLVAALPESVRALHAKGVRLVTGCRTDDVRKVADHVSTYIGTEAMNAYGGLALADTIEWVRFCLKKVRILLEAGAPVNTDLGYHTPIAKAARAGDPALIRLLIDHGADPNLGTEGIQAPLMVVCGADRIGHDRCFAAKEFDETVDASSALLLEAGADVNAADSEGLTPLMVAAEVYPHNMERLLKAGADPTATHKYGWTAARWAGPKIVEELKKAGHELE